MVRRSWLWLLGLLLAAGGLPAPAHAHAGAPYVVLPEQLVGPYTVIVWADADVGTAMIAVEVGLGNRAPPDRTTVTVTVWPDDQRRAEASVETERQDAGNRAVFVARPIFDGEGTWLVRVRLVGPAASDDVTFLLEVTPPYPPWIAYIWCLVPLIALCALWATGVRRQAQVPAPAARGSAQP